MLSSEESGAGSGLAGCSCRQAVFDCMSAEGGPGWADADKKCGCRMLGYWESGAVPRLCDASLA